jgi:hypothetical protein
MHARTSGFRSGMTPEFFNARAKGYLGGLLGLEILAVTLEGAGRKIAMFRCTQMVLWPM